MFTLPHNFEVLADACIDEARDWFGRRPREILGEAPAEKGRDLAALVS